MSKLSTVNVIKTRGEIVEEVWAFSEDEEGNSEAEDKFAEECRIHDQDLRDKDIESFLEDGYYEHLEERLFLCHSN